MLAGATAFGPAIARPQPAKKTPIVGFLHPGFPARGSATIDALRRDMGDQGLIDGQTVRIEERWAEGRPEYLRQAARELVVELKADVVVAVARASTDAVLAVSRTVPIVMNDLENDPVAAGWAASVAKPGGNVTGLFVDAPSICGKWLQLVTELVPGLRKAGVLWDSATGPYQRDAFLAAAKAVPLETMVIEHRGAGTIEASLAAGLTADLQAVVLLGSPLVNQAGSQLAAVLADRRLPGLSPFRTFPDNGGLMSYGTDLLAMYRRLVPFVAKVLRGARPGDLPFEQPTRFELVVNARTAKTLGIAMSPKFLLSAEEVIE